MDPTGFAIAGAYLPTILQRKNSAIDVSLKQTYMDYLIVYTPGIAAVILSVFMVRAPMVGRKWTLVFSSMVMGISLFLYSIVNTQASHIGFNMLEYFCQSLFNAAVSNLRFYPVTCSLRYSIVALRMDSRGVPFCSARDCNWFGLVFWQRAWWYLWSTDSCAAIQQHQWKQRRVVFGRQWPLCMYDYCVVSSDQGYGRTSINDNHVFGQRRSSLSL